MISWVEYVGDRPHGRDIRFYEIEQSDEEEIAEQVKCQLDGYDEENYPATVTVALLCPITEDEIEFEVDVKDYL